MTDTPLRAKKSLGQNFLHDAHYLAKIVEAARLKPDDLVVEIGPGLADLTRELARRVKRLVVIEIDDRLNGKWSPICPTIFPLPLFNA
jgi:16S rRNA A1518/A1519 N6-dimethyltransferase RsmA/KsgA/DIM1 with predicted DNA glycosylase/AP lyase activity